MRFSSKIKLSGSVMALSVAMVLVPGTAFAQATPSTTPPATTTQSDDTALPQDTLTDGSAVDNSKDIIVTGTSIKGVAPVGSNLVSVGRATIEKTAPINLSELTNTVPAISTAGSVAQGENAYSYYSPQIHSLAGSSSNTTLVIVDVLRLPGGGTQFAQTDHRSYNRDGQQFNVGETFAGLRFEKGVELAEALRPMVPAGLTMAQMALRWCLDFEAVSTVIPGAKSPGQARENAAVSDLRGLSDDLHERLRTFYLDRVATHIRGPY